VSSIEVGIQIIPSIFDRVYEGVDIIFGGIEIEGRADGRNHPQVIDKDFGAMLAAPAGNALGIQIGRGILGKNVLDIEGDNPGFALGVINDDVVRLFKFRSRHTLLSSSS
jgi:hypothetical protein